jgi:hypothetical protein
MAFSCREEDEGDGFKEVARYGGDYSLHNLRLFLASKTGRLIPLEGCSRSSHPKNIEGKAACRIHKMTPK